MRNTGRWIMLGAWLPIPVFLILSVDISMFAMLWLWLGFATGMGVWDLVLSREV